MKTFFTFLSALVLILLCNVTFITAQSVPNGTFENWISGTYDYPANYSGTSNPSVFFRCNTSFNCVKVADPYHGSYAIRLTTSGYGEDACFGYFINASTQRDVFNWPGGMPISQSPTGIRGYYKSAIPAGDSGFILTIFKYQGNVIALYLNKFYGTHSTYTPFQFSFDPVLPITPDSVIVGAASSDAFEGTAVNGSWLQLDSISFTGITTQPSQLNGDFENWQQANLVKPSAWYNLSGTEDGMGMDRTADAWEGSYAISIKSFPMISDMLTPGSQPGSIGTGYYYCPPGSDNCDLYGGYPFTNKKDTLSFYYKYAPAMSDDSASVAIFFRKNGTIINGVNKWLHAAPSYTYAELPFEMGVNPDSAIIIFTSSDYNHTYEAAYAGSELKIDQVRFKSQVSTGLFDFINGVKSKIYPNPTNGLFTVETDQRGYTVEVINTQGQIVFSTFTSTYRKTVDLTKHPKGVYFYVLKDQQRIIGKGKILVQ